MAFHLGDREEAYIEYLLLFAVVGHEFIVNGESFQRVCSNSCYILAGKTQQMGSYNDAVTNWHLLHGKNLEEHNFWGSEHPVNAVLISWKWEQIYRLLNQGM